METRQRLGNSLSRSTFLLGSGALLASASGLGAFAPAALADLVPDGDLAYLRLLIASELLAVDFFGQAWSYEGGAYRTVARKIRGDDSAHYTLLADLMTAAGQTPATAADIDFSYPSGTFGLRSSTFRFARTLEQMLVGAYIDAVQNVQTPAYRLTMTQILTHEAQHRSALAALQRQSLIGTAFPASVSMAAMSDFLDRYES